MKWIFESGEPDGQDEDPERPEECARDNPWNKDTRPPWQLHSETGPNVNPQPTKSTTEPLPDVVNPPDHDWTTTDETMTAREVDTFWEKLRENASNYDDATLSVDTLGDDYQTLFVLIVLQHVQALLQAAKTKVLPKPLRLFVLGTA